MDEVNVRRHLPCIGGRPHVRYNPFVARTESSAHAICKQPLLIGIPDRIAAFDPMHDEGTRFGLGRLPSDMRFEELSKLLSIGNCNIPAHDVLAVRKRLAKSGFLKLVKRSVCPLRAFLARVALERAYGLRDD